MAELILDHTFNNITTSNPDGTFKASFTGATVTGGPGNTPLGKFAKALDLGTGGKASIGLTGLNFDSKQFCIQVVFQPKGPVRSRQNLVESNALPFAMYLQKARRTGSFELIVTVATKAHGWRGPSTRFKQTLKVGRWYTASLVYDNDTVALFLDSAIVSVYAFPDGRILNTTGKKLFLGTWVDGRRDHFNGKLATLRWYKGIPEELESRLDERRIHAEWFVTYKMESIRRKLSFGEPTGALTLDRMTGASLQHYQRGAIMYHDSVGAAFEIHGGIYAKYKAMPTRSTLGHLVSDESSTTRAGGRKSVFSRGSIYWSRGTGAIPVQGQIYIDYEHLGESNFLGFPLKPARNVGGGLEQEFQRGRMYYRTGESNAQEVHGAILAKYLSTGGVAKWGFPVTNESDVLKGRRSVGKSSEFNNCTIYWTPRTGAHEVHGSIRRKYQELGGPIGELGFPTSDELDIPNYSGVGRINTFQKGSLLWYGNFDSIVHARPFKVFLGRLNTRESEAFGRGQNDLYCFVKLKDGSRMVYDKRHPRNGDWGGRNIKDVNLTIPNVITPNDPNKVVVFSVDVWENDGKFNSNDHLGKYTKRLNAANAWGLRYKNGVYNSGAFAKINSITWSVKPQVNSNSLSEKEKFWGVANQGTPKITYGQYASAFRDVDSEREWWDVTDWLEKAFYELVVDGLAKDGNCFGMALEAIYARKGSSVFGLPINRFNKWENVRKEFNIKHCYQVGSAPIWWFLGEFASGNTHDPKDVFNQTRRAFQRGNHPVICISQNYDFSGAPHCILPVAWDSSRKPWKITICDPNFPNEEKDLTVDPDKNTFKYISSASRSYSGGEWSGGRFHYMPFTCLNKPPRTPVWDAILLLLAGTILILADDGETESITDANGNDLDAFGTRALNVLKSGRHVEEYFVGFKGYDQATLRRPLPGGRLPRVPRVRRRVSPRGKGTVAGEILLRKEQRFAQSLDPGVFHFGNQHIGELVSDRRLGDLAAVLRSSPSLRKSIGDRTVHHVLNDPAMKAVLSREVSSILGRVAKGNAPLNFIHKVRGIRNGNLGYVVKHGLSEIQIGSSLKVSEQHNIEVNDVGTSKGTVHFGSGREKLVKLQIANKLGVKDDHLRVTIDRIPVDSARKLDVNVKPGLGGLELVSMGRQINASVLVDAVIGGKIIKRRFNLPLKGGVRIKLPSLLSENALNFSRIDQLFGPVRGSGRIQGGNR